MGTLEIVTIAAAGVSPWVLIPIGTVILIIIVRIFGKSTKLEDLQKDIPDLK